MRSSRGNGIKKFESSIRDIDGEFVAVTHEPLHRHIQALEARAGSLRSRPGNELLRCQTWSMTAFPRQDAEKVC
ncbi:hypothetical protein A5759_04555 [Mycobacterium sp. 852014-52144_SCH5372336]|nr:hypothetical protein A5759_04555 [Mycobacterium sp. 852014-52144_SCH5372336]